MATYSDWTDDDSEQLEVSRTRARQATVVSPMQRAVAVTINLTPVLGIATVAAAVCAVQCRSAFEAAEDKGAPQSPTRTYVDSLLGGFDESIESVSRPATAIPPGAHEDTYRVLYPHGASKQCTSERLFWTTTSMTEGIRVMPQPPWYFGYSNRVQPPDSDILNSATRYGYRGSQSIRQYTRGAHALPEHTLTDRTPQFLRHDTLQKQHSPNLWVPSLEARSSAHRQTPLNSPKLWPETASFVTGYKHRRPATSAWYRKETTATSDDAEQAAMDSRLARTIALLDYERDNFSASAHLERAGALLSRPHTMASVFWDTTGSPPTTSQFRRTKNETNRSNPAPPPTAAGNRTASSSSEQLRYSGTQTILVQQKPRDQLKSEQQTAQHPINLHLSLRWQNTFVAHRALSKALRRDRDTRQQVMKLAEQMRIQAKARGVPTLLSKGLFMRTLDGFGLFHLMTNKQRNWLFAVFDTSKQNTIRFVEMVAMLGVLDRPKDPPRAVLGWLWDLFEEFGRDQSPLENAKTIFLTCCYDEDERQAGLSMFAVLRNECYRRIATMTTSQALGAQVNERDTAVPSQFNLCDAALGFQVFMQALCSQQDCIDFFATTLANRIVQYQQYMASMSGS